MCWTLSRFRKGDLVEVCSKEEILATLDQDGCVGGMPFMPEMLQFCGQRFRVGAVAHKTCDTITQRTKSRGLRLQATVHLAGLRCDGSAHGGCQAACNLFWKDVWLRPVNCNESESTTQPTGARNTLRERMTESDLFELTKLPVSTDEADPRYSCQATSLLGATEPLPKWDLRQFAFDVVTRNHSLGKSVRVLILGSLGWLLRRVPYGYRVVKYAYDRAHELLTGRGSPVIIPKIPPGSPTPTSRLDLQPGELVRVKSKREIEETLDVNEKNRGLSFDPEMTPYCGNVYRVRSRIWKLVDERTGKMLHMKQPSVMLEGAVCQAEYSDCRLLCPRNVPILWREIWLERVDHSRP